MTILILTVLALGAAGSLMVLSSQLHSAVTSLVDAVEGVRHAHDASIDLIIHNRTRDRLVRAEEEADLKRVLRKVRQYTNSASEEENLAAVERQVNVYLAARQEAEAEGLSFEEIRERTAPEMEKAFSLLQDLIDINVTQALSEQEHAARLDRLANVLGITVAVMLLLGVSAVLLWLGTSAFRPIFQISDAIKRFGAGDKSVRVPESGPTELQNIARNFNETSATLARQREEQLTFLAGVAHDLRNPLSVLKLSTALVRPGQPLPSEEKIRKTFFLLNNQVERLNRMVSDLLDAAQIEAGRLDLRKEIRDARNILRDVFELYRSASPLHTITLSAPETPVPVYCDPFRIEQALNNLVSNAIKYSPEGGEVALSLSLEEEKVFFHIRDEGVGLALSEQKRLFTPFQRAGAGQGKISGSGLGLFVAGQIVKAHGGDIQVKSEPGKGSTFSISLPLAGA